MRIGSLKMWGILSLAVVLTFAITASALAIGHGRSGSAAAAGGRGIGGVCAALTPSDPSTTPPLSQAEKDSLLLMREEEKLARDVYQAMYEKWGARVFENIKSAETRHMTSVLTLIDRYGLADPASAQAGIFTSTELQAAYDSRLAQGSRSLADALQVGVTTERLDIEDLQTAIRQATHADLKTVYQNLLHASDNHLAAFGR
jgi:hypothetical protein